MERTGRIRGALLPAVFAALACSDGPTSVSEGGICQQGADAAPAQLGMDTASLEAAYLEAEGFGNMLAMLVATSDQVVCNEYFHGRDASSVFGMASLTKSVTSALTGVALEQGVLESLDEPVWPYFTDYLGPDPDPETRVITVRHLLTMTGGWAWDETGDSFQRWTTSSDPNAYLWGLPLEDPPGEAFRYTTAGVHALATLLSRAAGEPLLDFGLRTLFEPSGMTVPHWSQDQQGNYAGGGDLILRGIDMIRFGQLFLNGGRAGGRQVVPEAWVRESTTRKVDLDGNVDYGYLWWLVELNGYRAYYAAGFGGQYIIVVPELDLVVAVASTLELSNGYGNRVFQLVADKIIPAVQ